jgi:hypothetical protein
MVHTQRIHPTPLDLQLRFPSQMKKHTPSLSSTMIQTISPSSSITKMALFEPYTSTTVQHLLKTQACIPMTETYEANQWACPNNPSQLWCQSNPVHHVVDDPNTILLDLASRPIQVITTKHGSVSVCCAWALPHLDYALHNPTHQMTHNHFSFVGQHCNNPEYPYTNKTPDILLDINPGKFSTECTSNERSTQSIACNSLTPPCHSHNDMNAAIEDSCNAIRYALTKPLVPSKHNAFLAVLTLRFVTFA